MRYIRQIACLFAILASLTLVSLSATAQSLPEQQVFAAKIDTLLRAGDFDYAHAAMLKYLEFDPDAPPVKRKLAHYHMKTTAVATDGLIPFRYPEDSARQIIRLLDEVIVATPDDSEALSLLMYTHALQGNVELGNAALAKARLLSEKDDWLDYNAALLAIRENRLEEAAALLNSVAVEKNLPSGPDADRIYDSSWHTLYAIALEDPRLDPLPAVRDGLAERVNMDNVPEYLLEYDKDGPPILLQISSQDPGCGYCISEMKTFYDFARENRQQGNKYHVVYASLEPWRDIRKYADLTATLNITGVPAYDIVYQGEHLQTWSGYSAKGISHLFNFSPDTLAENGSMAVKVGPRSAYVLDLMSARFDKYKESEKSGYKAMAYATNTDARFWTYTREYGFATQVEADKTALENCRAKVEDREETVECRLYAQGDKIVDSIALNRNEDREFEKQTVRNRRIERKERQDAIRKAEASKPRPAAVARDAIAQFTNIEEHYKAIALAQDETGIVSGIASKALTQRRANSEALAKCDAARQEAQLSAECQLHSIGKVEVTDHTDANIRSVTAKQQKRNAKNSDLASSYTKYRKYSDDKAYAISIGDDGDWAYAMAFGKRGEEQATSDAMAECEINRKEKNLAESCQLLILNNQFIELDQ